MRITSELKAFISEMVRTRTNEAANQGERYSLRSFGRELGVSHATISRWINGRADDIKDEHAEALADLAGLSLFQLTQISYGMTPDIPPKEEGLNNPLDAITQNRLKAFERIAAANGKTAKEFIVEFIESEIEKAERYKNI